MVALPSNVTYGTITGQFIFGVADTAADTDALPEALPASGAVTFTPRNANGSSNFYVNDAGAKVILVIKPVTVTLDAAGYIVSPGNAAVRAVTLIASDNPAMNPRDWLYRVTFNFPGVSIDFFDMQVLAGTTLDLSSYIPISTAAPLGVPQAQALAAQAANSAQQVADALAANPGGGGSTTGGAATTAVKLATARTINGVLFDGTAPISIPASAVPSLATGDLQALTVQAALAELSTEKATVSYVQQQIAGVASGSSSGGRMDLGFGSVFPTTRPDGSPLQDGDAFDYDGAA